MKSYLSYILIVVFILLMFSALTGSEERDAAEDIISGLDWLAGDWVGDFEGNRFEAHYTSPEGGAILSVSKEFSEARPCFIEFEKFTIDAQKLVLTPYPNGKQSVSFTLVDYNPEVKRVRFENPNHDFPTDITYELVSEDSLIISVAGSIKGERKTLTVNLTRKK